MNQSAEAPCLVTYAKWKQAQLLAPAECLLAKIRLVAERSHRNHSKMVEAPMPQWHYLPHSFWLQSAGGSKPADTLSQCQANPHDQQQPDWEAHMPQQHPGAYRGPAHMDLIVTDSQ